MFKVTVPPGEVLADDSDNEDCASDALHVIVNKAVTRTGPLVNKELSINE
jgi:hypothetical protein